VDEGVFFTPGAIGICADVVLRGQGGSTMIAAVVLAVLIGIGFMWVAFSYNKLILLKNETLNGWKQIDVQLKRRYDLIPNLVETVKGVMKFEQETLTRVIEARNKAVSAQGVAEKAVQENMLTGALRQLFALVESYPQLKSNDNAAKLQEELISTENRIGFARQFYNDIATKFNIAQQSFPTNVIAGMFGFKNAELFEVAGEQEKQAPKVDLNLNK
jgi:LemA protein